MPVRLEGKMGDCGFRLLAPSLARIGQVRMVRPPLRVRTHCARLWTHSPLPRRSRYRTQALPEAPPPSNLTRLQIKTKKLSFVEQLWLGSLAFLDPCRAAPRRGGLRTKQRARFLRERPEPSVKARGPRAYGVGSGVAWHETKIRVRTKFKYWV
jgi:hypothetical protein